MISLVMIRSSLVKEWARNHLRPIIQSSPSLENLKNVVLAIRQKTYHSISVLRPRGKTKTKTAYPGTRPEENRGAESWISPFSDKIPPTESPSKGRVHPVGQARLLVLTGLKGETLSFQVVLRSEKPLQGIILPIQEDPANSGISFISTHRFLEICMRLMIHTISKYGPLKELINPDPLIPFTDPDSPGRRVMFSVSLKPNFDQPNWVDVHFAHQCRAGSYRGTAKSFPRVRSSGRLHRRLKFLSPHFLEMSDWAADPNYTRAASINDKILFIISNLTILTALLHCSPPIRIFNE